jgi:hypothetical protein
MISSNQSYIKPCSDGGKRLNLKIVNIFLGGSIIVLGIFYLVNVNDLTVKGFALKELKSSSNLLLSDNKDYEAKIMNLQSYNNLNDKVKKLNMVAVSDVEYLSVNTGTLARK